MPRFPEKAGQSLFFEKLTLDGADHNTLYEILLNEGIDAKDGQGCENDSGVLNELLIEVIVTKGRQVNLGATGVLDKDLTQDYLQRIEVSVGQINSCGQVLIPLTNCIEQSDNSNGSLGKGENYLEEDSQMSRTIELRRLFKAGRKRLECGLDDDDVEDADEAHSDDNPSGVNDAEELVNHVSGDKTTVEEHGEGQHDGEVLHPHGSSSGHAVCGQRGEDDAEYAAGANIEDGVSITSDEGVVLKNNCVTLQGCGMTLAGERPHDNTGMLGNMGGVTDGCHENVPQRNEANKGKSDKDDGVDNLKRYTTRSFFNLHSQFPP